MLERVELRSEYGSFSRFAQVMSLVDDVNRLAETSASWEDPSSWGLQTHLPLSTHHVLRELVGLLNRKDGLRRPYHEYPPSTRVADLLVHHLLASLPGWPDRSNIEDPELFSLQLADVFLREWALFIRRSPEFKDSFQDVVRAVAGSIPRVVHWERVWPPNYSYFIDDTAIRFTWKTAQAQDVGPLESSVHVSVVAAEMNSPLSIAFGISLGVIVGVPIVRALRAPALVTAAWRFIDARVRRAEAEAGIREEERGIRAAERRAAESHADMAEAVASACADVGLEDPSKLVPVMQTMAQPLSRAASDLRNNDVSIQLFGKKTG
jgi:hypothetical protein